MNDAKEDTRTEQELIQEALDVQNACNLSGVVHSFSRGITRLWAIQRENGDGAFTIDINRHRYCRLFASKIESLAGTIEIGDFDPN